MQKSSFLFTCRTLHVAEPLHVELRIDSRYMCINTAKLCFPGIYIFLTLSLPVVIDPTTFSWITTGRSYTTALNVVGSLIIAYFKRACLLSFVTFNFPNTMSSIGHRQRYSALTEHWRHEIWKGEPSVVRASNKRCFAGHVTETGFKKLIFFMFFDVRYSTT